MKNKHTERFHLRLTPQDKEVISFLAEKLQSSESYAYRFAAREYAEAIKAGNVPQVKFTQVEHAG